MLKIKGVEYKTFIVKNKIKNTVLKVIRRPNDINDFSSVIF